MLSRAASIGRTWRFVGLGSLAAVVLFAALLSGAVVYLAGSEPGPVSGSVVGVSRGVEPGVYRVGEFMLGAPLVWRGLQLA